MRAPVGARWLTAHAGETMVARQIAGRSIVSRNQFWIKEHQSGRLRAREQERRFAQAVDPLRQARIIRADFRQVKFSMLLLDAAQTVRR